MPVREVLDSKMKLNMQIYMRPPDRFMCPSIVFQYILWVVKIVLDAQQPEKKEFSVKICLILKVHCNPRLFSRTTHSTYKTCMC